MMAKCQCCQEKFETIQGPSANKFCSKICKEKYKIIKCNEKWVIEKKVLPKSVEKQKIMKSYV